MQTEQLFQDIKSKLIVGLEHATLKDFKEYLDWAMPHYKIITELSIIEETYYQLKLKENGKIIETVLPEDKKLEAVEELPIVEEHKTEIKEESIEEVAFPFGVEHTFVLKASGGIIREMDYPIPEEIVQLKELKNGNKIRVTEVIGTFFDNRTKYDFEVVDATEIPHPNLIEVKQGIIDLIAERLVVTETIYGSLGKDDQQICLYISEKDAKKNGRMLKKGDIIDGRYYVNNVNSFRVSQKYDTDINLKNVSVESKKLAHRQNNVAATDSGVSMLDRLDKTPFVGLKILLIGLGSRANDFEALIEKCEDLNIIHLNGYEHKVRIRSQIQKADYVLLSTYENGHGITKYAANICNEYDIPFTSTHNDGFVSVLRDAKDLIDKTRNIATTSKGA